MQQAHPRILIVDDDPIVADSFAEFLRVEGYETATAGDGAEALQLLDASEDAPSPASGDDHASLHGPFGVVLTDVNMPRLDGLEFLRRVRTEHESIVPIVVTGFGKIQTAVEAIKLGAADYLTKPVVDDELRIAIGKAMSQHALLAENRSLRAQLSGRNGLANIVGGDWRMQKVYELVEAVAPSRTTVLIDGASGTGKSMIARAIHTLSPRGVNHAAGGGPFVTFSCGSIPETLLESELFGHVKGAFTGADRDKEGKLQAADGGTLFIDEINSATPALQLKLLRVLQEKQFEPVGSNTTLSVDVRFVLATNQPLRPLVEQGAFREDLFYRINVVNVKLPLLHERVGDIPLLAEHFLEKYRKEVGKQVTGFSDEAIDALRRYHWPGNVRELENAVERAVVLSRRPVIEPGDLPEAVLDPDGIGHSGNGSGASGCGTQAGEVIPALREGWTPMPLDEAMREPERRIIAAALEANDWNRQETARQLDINRTTLYKKIKQFELEPTH